MKVAGASGAGASEARAVEAAPEPDLPPAPPPAEPVDDAPWEGGAADGGADGMADPATFEAVVQLALEKREAILHANLYSNFHLVRFEPGRIEFHPGDHAPQELAHDLSKFLNDNTARRWVVTVSREPGQATLQQQDDERVAKARAEAARDPLVKTVLEAFPGAVIDSVE
jgi:DNA polymerase-3 subunit gamma/tau